MEPSGLIWPRSMVGSRPRSSGGCCRLPQRSRLSPAHQVGAIWYMAKLLNMVTFIATISLTSMYCFLWVFCLLEVLFPAWWYELEWIPVHLTGSCLEVMASHSGWAADDSTPWYFTSLILKRCGNANALNLWIGMNMSDRCGMYQYYAVIILNRSSHIIYHENIV